MKHKIILLNFLISIGTVCFAQEDSLVSKYREMALAYNQDLKAAYKNISASMELESASRKDLMPKLSGNANFQYTGNPLELSLQFSPSSDPVTFQGKDLKYGASLSLVQPLYSGGRILESIKMAQHQQSLATHQREFIHSAICYQTDIQYWTTVARSEIIKVTEDYYNSISSLSKTISERVKIGLTDPQDLLMVEVKLNDAAYKLLQAKNSFNTSRMALNSLIGVELEHPTIIDEVIPTVVVPSSMMNGDGTSRPEIMMALDKIDIAKTGLRINDSKYKPQLGIGIDGSYSSPGYNFRSDLDPNYAVYAKLSVPIFEWGKRRNEKKASFYRIEIAKDNLNKVSDNISLEIETSRISLKQSIEQIKLTESSLQKAYDNEKIAFERYKEGKISIVEVIDAQNYRQAAQTNYVEAKVSAQNYYSQLLKALNRY